MRPVAASVGPGWVQRTPWGPFHLLDAWPIAGARRVSVWHGSVKLTPVSLFWAYTNMPVEPCGDCDRARQVARIVDLAARL